METNIEVFNGKIEEIDTDLSEKKDKILEA